MLYTENEPSFKMTETETTKSAAELRKQNKPLMEKRRRARINESLNKLKSLVLDAMKRDTSRYSKLEKADILEMTVKHLRSVQRQQMAVAMANDTTVISKYRAGFLECASEVTRYLSSIDGLDPQVRTRLLNHLTDCTQKVATLSANMAAMHHHQQDSVSASASAAAAAHAQGLLVRHPYLHHSHQVTLTTNTPGTATGYETATPTSTSGSVTSTTPGGDPQHVTGAFHVVPPGVLTSGGGPFAVMLPTANDTYSLPVVSTSTSSSSSGGLYSVSAHRPSSTSFRSMTSTSPGMLSPMSVTSPTSSERVFRYGSASDASSSEDDDEQEVAVDEPEVALDMRVEPVRDINANIVKSSSSSPGRGMPPSRQGQVGQPSSVMKPQPAHQGAIPATAESMWRPW